MKIIIEIDQDGFSKTVTKNDGTVLVEKWEKDTRNSFSRGKDVFSDSNLLEETIDALSDCDSVLIDLVNAIETETAPEYLVEGEEAITVDGHQLKRGDVFYVVAVMGENYYQPIPQKYPQDWGSGGDDIFYDRAKCVDRCNEYKNQ